MTLNDKDLTRGEARELALSTGQAVAVNPMGTNLDARKALPVGFKKSGEIGAGFIKLVIPLFEDIFEKQKRFPTQSELMTTFGFTAEEANLTTGFVHEPAFRLALLKRGLPDPKTVNDNGIQFRLSERQLAAITVISSAGMDRRPYLTRLAEFIPPVAPEELANWKKQPVFRERLQSEVDAAFYNANTDATMNLTRLISAPDGELNNVNLSAIKFYYEITGRAEAPETQNLKAALQATIESVQKHVKDPELLKSISEEIDSLLNRGGNVI